MNGGRKRIWEPQGSKLHSRAGEVGLSKHLDWLVGFTSLVYRRGASRPEWEPEEQEALSLMG